MEEQIQETEVVKEGLGSLAPSGGNAMTSIENAANPGAPVVGNILEQQEIARNLSETQLIEYAKSPNPSVIPSYLVTAELMRRKSNKDKEAKAPDFTVAQEVVAEAEQGIMSQMQRQAPKMPPGGFVPPMQQRAPQPQQRRPQMNPPGIMGQMRPQVPQRPGGVTNTQPQQQMTREQIMARGVPTLPNPGNAMGQRGMAQGGIIGYAPGGPIAEYSRQGLYFPGQYNAKGVGAGYNPYINSNITPSNPQGLYQNLKPEMIDERIETLTETLKPGYERGQFEMSEEDTQRNIAELREQQEFGLEGRSDAQISESFQSTDEIIDDPQSLGRYAPYPDSTSDFKLPEVSERLTTDEYMDKVNKSNAAFGVQSSEDFYAPRMARIAEEKAELLKDEQDDLNLNLMQTGLGIIESGNIPGGAKEGVERYIASKKETKKMNKLVEAELRAEERMQRTEDRGDAKGYMTATKDREALQFKQVELNIKIKGEELKANAARGSRWAKLKSDAYRDAVTAMDKKYGAGAAWMKFKSPSDYEAELNELTDRNVAVYSNKIASFSKNAVASRMDGQGKGTESNPLPWKKGDAIPPPGTVVIDENGDISKIPYRS
mgnify:FL=1